MSRRRGLYALCAAVALAIAPACTEQSSSTTEGRTPLPVPATTTAVVVETPTDRQILLDRERERYGSLGALATVRDGTGEWIGTSGVADSDGTDLTDTTRFRVASITKPIVAALVLDAVAAGLLSLDNVVHDLIPGAVRAEPPITVRMLLDHTSGVFDQVNDGRAADVDQLPDPGMRAEAKSLVRRYADGEAVIVPDRIVAALAETHDRYFHPGSGYHYSNTNYQLAAMVLEAVTGISLADLLDVRIAVPLGLEHTTLTPPDLESPELRGYVPGRRDGMYVDVTDDLVEFGNGGNGGVISTPDELLTIMQAIVSGQIVAPHLVEDMTTMTSQSDFTYGLGLVRYELSCGTFYGHEGKVSGTVSIAVADTDGSRGAVIAFNLANDTDPGLVELADALLCTN